jgi:hypothetical protein
MTSLEYFLQDYEELPPHRTAKGRKDPAIHTDFYVRPMEISGRLCHSQLVDLPAISGKDLHFCLLAKSTP